MFYQYLPIKMANNGMCIYEQRLNIFGSLIRAVIEDLSIKEWNESYIYLTAKHVFVNSDYAGNRPGWHSDGFMTNDINYIWCDSEPTIFTETKFDLTLDHSVSLQEMAAQDNPDNDISYPVFSLLKLDQYVIHRAPENCKPGFRTFVKISVSKEKYNLIGNSHNYLLDYQWDMQPRQQQRNHPIVNL